MATKSLAQDLFEDMGRKVAEAQAQEDVGELGSKVVDEIESLCMNCHDNVCHEPSEAASRILTLTRAQHGCF
jgi:hypothetical protein